MHQQHNFNFRNWAGNQSSVAKNYFAPASEEELVNIIRQYQKNRLVGTGHSWSSLCVTDATLISTVNYNQVLHLDKDNLQVTIQSGVKLWQLNAYLDQHGLALKNLGSISEQSVVGAICTGTHGSGKDYQILGSQVVSFSIIKADGNKQVIHSENDQVLFNQALINLGALGIVSEMTLQVVPAFQLHEQIFIEDFETALQKLEEWRNTTDHLKFWWFPHTDKMIVYLHNRTQQPRNDSRFRQWLMEEVISVYAYRFFVWIGTLNRNWRKTINRMLLANFIRPIDRIEKSYKVFNVPRPPIHREAEWAFDVALAADVLRAYKQKIDNSSHRINFLQEIRFSKADNFALSPSFSRDTVWIGCYNIDNFGWVELMHDFEEIGKHYNGRPHWGKEFTVNKNYLQGQYPDWSKFIALKRQFDPMGKFENKMIAELFS
jgi:FAD/FMN-containing dehydrogenase